MDAEELEMKMKCWQLGFVGSTSISNEDSEFCKYTYDCTARDTEPCFVRDSRACETFAEYENRKG